MIDATRTVCKFFQDKPLVESAPLPECVTAVSFTGFVGMGIAQPNFHG